MQSCQNTHSLAHRHVRVCVSTVLAVQGTRVHARASVGGAVRIVVAFYVRFAAEHAVAHAVFAMSASYILYDVTGFTQKWHSIPVVFILNLDFGPTDTFPPDG